MLFLMQGKKDMQWDDIMLEKNYNAVDAYCQSKLANILFNVELSKRVKSSYDRKLYCVISS